MKNIQKGVKKALIIALITIILGCTATQGKACIKEGDTILTDNMSSLVNWEQPLSTGNWAANTGQLKGNISGLSLAIPKLMAKISEDKDYSITADFSITDGALIVLLRDYNFTGYSIYVTNSSASLVKSTSKKIEILLSANKTINEGTLKASINGNNITLTINNEELLNYQDKTPLTSGRIGLSMSRSIGGLLYNRALITISNIEIKKTEKC